MDDEKQPKPDEPGPSHLKQAGRESRGSNDGGKGHVIINVPENESEDKKNEITSIFPPHNTGSRLSTESGPGRSVGVSVKMNNSTTRTRIDNLGGYHEYPYRAEQEVAALKRKATLAVSGSGDQKMLSTIETNDSDTQSHIMMNEIRGFISADSPVTITALMATSKIFIQKSREKIFPWDKKKNKLECCCIPSPIYEVLNHQNRRIFFLKQTKSTSWWAFLLLYGFIRQSFGYTVLDNHGKPALVVNGSQYLFGIYITSTIKYADGSILGLMKQSICDGSYKVNDDKDRIMFTLVGPVFSCYAACIFWCFDEEFEIFLSGSANEVGRIGKFWKTDEFQTAHSHIGASFPVNMSVRSKAILVGALLTTRWQYFVSGGNGAIIIVIYVTILISSILIYYFWSHNKS